jgi:hypothetical protein
LLVDIVKPFRRLQVVGALVAVAVMTGAISFHLSTPLGIDPNNDGGRLFVAAVVVWLPPICLLTIRRKDALEIFQGLKSTLFPSAYSDVKS